MTSVRLTGEGHVDHPPDQLHCVLVPREQARRANVLQPEVIRAIVMKAR